VTGRILKFLVDPWGDWLRLRMGCQAESQCFEMGKKASMREVRNHLLDEFGKDIECVVHSSDI
jgi:hypothetical protein